MKIKVEIEKKEVYNLEVELSVSLKKKNRHIRWRERE